MAGRTNRDSGIIASDMDLTLAAIVIMGAWVVGIAAAGLVMVLRPGGVAVRLAPAGGGAVAPTGRRDEAVFDLQRLLRRLALENLEQKDVDDFARVEAGREAAGLQGVLATASSLSYRETNGLGGLSIRKDPGSHAGLAPGRLKELAVLYLKPESWIVIKAGPSSP